MGDTWKWERSDPGLTLRKRLSTRWTRLAGRSSAARPPSSDSGGVSTAAAHAAASPSDSTCIAIKTAFGQPQKIRRACPDPDPDHGLMTATNARRELCVQCMQME